MKKFKVVAQGAIMDAEMNVKTMDEAHEIFEQLRESGSYHKIYIKDIETGELYHIYDINEQCGGVLVLEWFNSTYYDM